MSKKKSIILLTIFVWCVHYSYAQTDTSYWFAAPAICSGHENTPEVFRLSSYGKPADITISQPANPSFQPYTQHLEPYSAATVNVTQQLGYVENKPENTLLNYGIKITSTSNIAAYYEVGYYKNPEIFSLKGKVAMGLKFLIPGQTRFANATGSDYLPQPKNGFVIVATEDNTSVDIGLSNQDMGNHPAGSTFNIVLNKGQSYAVVAKNYVAGTHLGGSTVKANKPVCITIYDDSVGPSTTSNRDLIGDQILPEDNNGTEFIIVRGSLSFDTPARDYYYIWATVNGTKVSVNGSEVKTLDRGQVYEGFLSDPSAYIVTSQPVYLYQVTGVGGEMASTNLPSIKCTGSQLVSFVRSTSDIFYMNLLCRKTEIGNFLLNGKAVIPSSLFSVVPGTSNNWLAARISSDNLSNIDDLIQAGNTTVVSNTSGLFHLGFLNGSPSLGTRLGYFSNYSIAVLDPVITTTSCMGDKIQLSSTNISGAEYSWKGPNNFTSNKPNPVLPNADPNYNGVYWISANIPGCPASSDSLVIVVHPLPTVSFVSTRDSVCYGSSKNITYTLTGNSPWTLTYSDGVKDSTLQKVLSATSFFTVSPAANTVYSIKKVTDANDCVINPQTITSVNKDTVTVKALPTGIIESPQFCAANGKPFKISFTGKAPWTLVYLLGSKTDTIYQINNPSYSFLFSPTAPSTTFKIISVSDGSGCMNDTLKQTATIYPQPYASFAVNSEVCLRDTVVFTDYTDGRGFTIVKWNWSFGDGSIDTLKNPKHVFITAGVDSVKLFAFSNKGCVSDTLTRAILINPLPVAGFTVSAPLCETRQLVFTDTSKANAGDLVTWNWNMGNGDKKELSDKTPFTQLYTIAGNYPVSLVVKNSKGCKSDTLVTELPVHPLPHVGFILPEICLGDIYAQFADTSSITDGSEGQFSYTWNFYTGTPSVTIPPAPLTSPAKNPLIRFNESNNYSVSLRVTSKDGCADSLLKVFTVNGSTPKADFTILQPASLCSNDSIRITDKSTVNFGSITKVEIYWDSTSTQKQVDDYPTSGTGAGKTYSHFYSNLQVSPVKKYYIRFVSYSGISCVNSKLDSVTVLQSPRVQFTTIPGICNDTTIRQLTQASELTGILGNGVYSANGLGIISSSGLYNPRIVSPGIYPVKYIYTANNSCKDSAMQSITVWPSPVAKWGIIAPICEHNPVTFIDSSVANYGKIKNSYWDFGDGTTPITGDQASFTKVYLSANTYTASLYVKTDSGCKSPYNTQVVKVNYTPTVSFDLPAGICLPDGKGTFKDATTIADNSQSSLSYLWNFGDFNDASASTLQNPIHQYSALGPYTVKLKVTSKNGCSDSLSKVLSQVYPQPKADFSVIPASVCVNDIISFNDLSDGITSKPVSWAWDLAEGNTSTSQNTSRQFKDSGNFTISLSIQNEQGCISDTARREITVYPYPILKMGPGRVMLTGGVITLVPLYAYGTNLSYHWSPSTYLNYDTVAHPQASPPDDMEYKLELTGIGNCTVSDKVNISVLKMPIIPNAFSPNGDGINDLWVIPHLDSYPGCTVDVFDRYGQPVFHSVGYPVYWDGRRKGSSLPVGTYYYIINPKNGRPTMSGSVTIIR